MDFYINQGATMPYIFFELVEDGLEHNYRKFYDKIQNAVVTFTMIDRNSCKKKIICRPMVVIEDKCGTNCYDNCFPKYLLLYKWRNRDTKDKGTYEGIIEIKFLDDCGKLIVPIREKLYINVI